MLVSPLFQIFAEGSASDSHNVPVDHFVLQQVRQHL